MEEAKYSATLRAIEKLQTIYNVKIIDINFYELQQCKNEKIILEHEMEGLAHEMKGLKQMSTCLEKKVEEIIDELHDLQTKYDQLLKDKNQK